MYSSSTFVLHLSCSFIFLCEAICELCSISTRLFANSDMINCLVGFPMGFLGLDVSVKGTYCITAKHAQYKLEAF